MAWLSDLEFREIYVTESATETTSVQLNHCLDDAMNELEMLFDTVTIAEIADDTENALSKVKAFRLAQGKLALRALLLLRSRRFRDGGIIRSESDANGGSSNSYESFAETEAARAVLYSEAIKAVSGYLVTTPGTVRRTMGTLQIGTGYSYPAGYAAQTTFENEFSDFSYPTSIPPIRAMSSEPDLDEVIGVMSATLEKLGATGT